MSLRPIAAMFLSPSRGRGFSFCVVGCAMPKRTDIRSILIIGAGPIVIGQACEFDYSGAQACKALREEGYRIVLVNSNPATIMTDPGLADATYIEPITPEVVERIIAKERPDALLPTMGGQTALNTAMALAARRHAETPRRRADRRQGRCHRQGRGPPAVPRGDGPHRAQLAQEPDGALLRGGAGERSTVVGLPAVIRPSFTLGGTGGGIAYNNAEFEEIVRGGLRASPIHEVLIEESVLGWKEYEMEVVRDRADNCIIICSIENVDPMGVHTGDSVTVAPALTLTDKEYQLMRNASIAVLREIGVDTGGSNVQFAVNPKDGHLVIIEMNPRVSRSSALASKATGFPIAKVAAKLAVGYTLDELTNDITRVTPATLRADHRLRRHQDAALHLREVSRRRGDADDLDEIGRRGDGDRPELRRVRAEGAALDGDRAHRLQRGRIPGAASGDRNAMRAALARPTPDRLLVIAEAYRQGLDDGGNPRRLQIRSLVPRRGLRHRRCRGRSAPKRPAVRRAGAAALEADGLLRCAAGRARRARGERGRGAARAARHPSRLQAHRHLRRRISLAHALHVFHL